MYVCLDSLFVACMAWANALLPTLTGYPQLAVVVKNRVTPKRVALVNGTQLTKTCGPIPGMILTPN